MSPAKQECGRVLCLCLSGTFGRCNAGEGLRSHAAPRGAVPVVVGQPMGVHGDPANDIGSLSAAEAGGGSAVVKATARRIRVPPSRTPVFE